jgi:hypothetical protein
VGNVDVMNAEGKKLAKRVSNKFRQRVVIMSIMGIAGAYKLGVL